MIGAVMRTGFISLRRDRAALALSFILPIAFFSIFAVIFGGRRDTLPKVSVIVVDEDRSHTSTNLVLGLNRERALVIMTRPASGGDGAQRPDYTAVTAEAAVKAGDAPVALIVPLGFGENAVAAAGDPDRAAVQLLSDGGDLIAGHLVASLLQKVAAASIPEVIAERGSTYADQLVGGFTPYQRERLAASLEQLRRQQAVESGAGDNASRYGPSTGGIIAVKTRAVVGENKKNPMVSFYAAGIGVMFLLFTASSAAGSLLDEADSGTLERVLSSRVTMTTLLAGKLAFGMLLAFSQLVVMFVWAWAVFKLDFLDHIPGFVVMGVCTAFAVGAFGMLLASICRTRAQLGAVSTLAILIMSSVGGSMFPRFLMPVAMQKAGLFTINAWAIDGFTKVFWRDEPISHLWPQILVLLAVGVVLFAIARNIARRWESV